MCHINSLLYANIEHKQIYYLYSSVYCWCMYVHMHTLIIKLKFNRINENSLYTDPLHTQSIIYVCSIIHIDMLPKCSYVFNINMMSFEISDEEPPV